MYRSNQLLVEISKKSHAENLLRTTLFHNLKVRVFPHTSLNSSRGVIRCPDLRNSSEEEILEGTGSQGVTAVKRFKIKRNGQLKDTNTFVFTFNTQYYQKQSKWHTLELVWRSTFQIRYAATVARNMDTTKTGVRKTLSVQIVVSRQITRNKIVEMLLNVLTVVKNTVLALKNVRFGTEKKKF